MEAERSKKRIAILGGGPSGLFMYKRLVECGNPDMDISIFERKNALGEGMPYSREGANEEHITNVSDNEIPEMVTSIKEWLKSAPAETLKRFDMTPEKFNEYKVVPRLLFGEYLSAQFDLLQQRAKKAGIATQVHLKTIVTDIVDDPKAQQVRVVTNAAGEEVFDCVIISIGHNWPKKHEGAIPNYFDSPYPPAKLAKKVDYPVAIKGSSLTAIDAVRTLARHNGSFGKLEDGTYIFNLAEESHGFKLVMHSLDGLLPAIRFHLEDSHLSKEAVLDEDDVKKSMEANDGFIPLDYIFEENFKQAFRNEEPEFYDKIRDMRIEDFVEHVMSLRERLDAFQLFKAEYAEAEKSIKRRQSVYWKEMLAILSFAMNYPAKHLSAEDMIRLKKVLMPLISIVIAFVPQSSCREMLALYDAGVLSLVNVDAESRAEPQEKGGAIYHYTAEDGNKQSIAYQLFVDAVGQPHLSYKDFPFKSLLNNGSISPARLKFRNTEEGQKQMDAGNDKVEQDIAGGYYLNVPGITINDNFQVIDKYGAYSDRIYIMAVPYIGGYNPDYSGLDFCEAASARIIKRMMKSEVVSEKV